MKYSITVVSALAATTLARPIRDENPGPVILPSVKTSAEPGLKARDSSSVTSSQQGYSLGGAISYGAGDALSVLADIFGFLRARDLGQVEPGVLNARDSSSVPSSQQGYSIGSKIASGVDEALSTVSILTDLLGILRARNLEQKELEAHQKRHIAGLAGGLSLGPVTIPKASNVTGASSLAGLLNSLSLGPVKIPHTGHATEGSDPMGSSAPVNLSIPSESFPEPIPLTDPSSSEASSASAGNSGTSIGFSSSSELGEDLSILSGLLGEPTI